MSTGAQSSERRVIAFLAFLSVLLAFGVDVSLPALDEIRSSFDLGPGSGAVSLIVTTYLLGMAAGQMIYGTLSDRFGRVPMLLVGIGLYAAGALGSALAPEMNVLLAARFMWGVGAASPSVLRPAIARDLYEGDQMARITSIVMAIFLIGPALAPSVGELIMLAGSWRFVFVGGVVLAFAAASWAIRFGETLANENRRSVHPAAVGRAFRTVIRNRASFGYILSMTFSFGAFFIYLDSGQPIISEIYGRGEWFALLFAGSSISIAAAVLISTRYTTRHGAASVARFGVVSHVTTATAFTAVALTTDGRPPFWVWYAFLCLMSSFNTLLTPTANALAMFPMARLAGAASGVLGFITIGGGAFLAAIVDSRIVDTVTPMAVGNLTYGLLSLAALVWASGGSLDPVDPESGQVIRSGHTSPILATEGD